MGAVVLLVAAGFVLVWATSAREQIISARAGARRARVVHAHGRRVGRLQALVLVATVVLVAVAR